MPANKYDFTIEQGTSFKISMIYKDANGNPVDLSNWCARLTWKTNTNTVYTFSSQNTNLSLYSFAIDGINGKLTLMIPASVTNTYNFSLAKYDLELQSPDYLYNSGGKYTIRLLSGTVSISRRYSQSQTQLECST